MSSQAQAAEAHVPATGKLFVMVWIGLVAITGIEVLLAYNQIAPGIMLTVLVGLSIIKAGMIMAWFSHLQYEKFGLVRLLVSAFMFCVGKSCVFFFPDC